MATPITTTATMAAIPMSCGSRLITTWTMNSRASATAAMASATRRRRSATELITGLPDVFGCRLSPGSTSLPGPEGMVGHGDECLACQVVELPAGLGSLQLRLKQAALPVAPAELESEEEPCDHHEEDPYGGEGNEEGQHHNLLRLVTVSAMTSALATLATSVKK